MLALVNYIRSGGHIHPLPGSVDARRLAGIPNLVWKDANHEIQINPLVYSPPDLDYMTWSASNPFATG